MNVKYCKTKKAEQKLSRSLQKQMYLLLGGKSMTNEARRIALKEESEVRSIIAQLGLCKELRGTQIIRELIKGHKNTKKLSDKEIDLVIYSWDSRYDVPIDLIDPKESFQTRVDNLQIQREEGETQTQYNRRKVEMIERYLRTIPS